MKTSFLPKLVNGHSGDPALFVDLLHEKRALLFDCGQLVALSPSEILRITDVFVSHMHIDHFIGFDHLLRLHVGRSRRVRIFGPRGITGCVAGKLAGYTWNLVGRQRLVFEVYEWGRRQIRRSEFFCRHKFRSPRVTTLPGSSRLWEDQLLQVECAPLDHHITSLAFSVKERDFLNVNPVELKRLGYRPGPWLNQLKQWVRQGRPEGGSVSVNGESLPAAPLAERLLIVTRGKKLVYIADAVGSEQNVARAVELAKDADMLYCEAAFLHEDIERATETRHLTARQAGEIARLAGAKKLVVFHFSPKYEGRFSELHEEARQAFGREG